MRCSNKVIHILLLYQCILQINGYFQLVAADTSSRIDDDKDNRADPSLVRDDNKEESVDQSILDQSMNNIHNDKVEDENEEDDEDEDAEYRYIIKYKPNTSHHIISQSSIRQHKKVIMNRKESNIDIEVMLLKHNEMKQIEEEDDVEYVEKDYKFYKLNTLRNMEQENTPYGIDLVNATLVDASKISNRNVCIIDSGYDLGHPDLQESKVTGYEGSESAGPWDTDNDGHGTHVAGTIAALGGNGQGVVGVVPNGMLNLHIIRAFNDNGDWAWGSNLIDAMYDCVDAGSNVINMSLGSPSGSQIWEDGTKDIYENKNVLLIAAAGNDGSTSYSYPASYISVMSVAAVDSKADRVYFSQYNDKVDIAGPGWYVESTYPRTLESYASLSGTSMATPHVAGVAALVWSHFDSLTAIQIRRILEHTAIDLGDSGRDDKYGHGLIDAKAAYDFLANDNTISPTMAPTPFNCKNGTIAFKLDLMPDYFSFQTSWTVVNMCTGETVLDGGENGDLTCLYEGYYVFTIYDYKGDGICCSYGSGSYSIFYDGDLVKSGGEFGYEESTVFGSDTFSCSPSSAPTVFLCEDEEKKFDLHLTHDRYDFETTWALHNMDSGESLLDSDEDKTRICLGDDSYNFTIYDTFGDGICCDDGTGSYKIYFDGILIKEGGVFGYQESTVFGNLPSFTPSISQNPSQSPIIFPSSVPSISSIPSMIPTGMPSISKSPSSIPTLNPTSYPSQAPTQSQLPSSNPSLQPTSIPSQSQLPSTSPSLSPSSNPSNQKSQFPSYSKVPSSRPTLISSKPSTLGGRTFSTKISLGFRYFLPMDDRVEIDFAKETRKFLLQYKRNTIRYRFERISVNVTSQNFVYAVQDGVQQSKTLEGNIVERPSKGLIVDLMVSAYTLQIYEYNDYEIEEKWTIKEEESFPFANSLFYGLHVNFPSYKSLLLDVTDVLTDVRLKEEDVTREGFNIYGVIFIGMSLLLILFLVLLLILGRNNSKLRKVRDESSTEVDDQNQIDRQQQGEILSEFGALSEEARIEQILQMMKYEKSQEASMPAPTYDFGERVEDTIRYETLGEDLMVKSSNQEESYIQDISKMGKTEESAEEEKQEETKRNLTSIKDVLREGEHDTRDVARLKGDEVMVNQTENSNTNANTWSCPVCTYINKNSRADGCEMCGFKQ